MPRYDAVDQREAAQAWRMNGRNMSKLSRVPKMPSRKTLDKWRKAGKPKELTGGDPWDVWADRADAKDEADARAEKIERRTKEELSWADGQKRDIEELLAEAHRQLTGGGGEPITAAQYTKLVDAYMKVDNLSREKLEWGQNLAANLLAIVMRHVGEKQFADIKLKFQQLLNKEREKLPQVPPGEEVEEGVFMQMPYRPDAPEEAPEEVASQLPESEE